MLAVAVLLTADQHVATVAASAPRSHNTPKEQREAAMRDDIVASWSFNAATCQLEQRLLLNTKLCKTDMPLFSTRSYGTYGEGEQHDADDAMTCCPPPSHFSECKSTMVTPTKAILLSVFAALSASCVVEGFSPSQQNARRTILSTSQLSMGLFDGIAKAFANEEYSAPPEGIKATARHILVKEKDQVDVVMERLRDGAPFAEVAREFSTCPSGSSGGSLGSFSPGTMVKEFDAVIFDNETNIGELMGPVQTQFGYHLIVVDKRTGV